MGKRELVALLNLSSWCLMMVEWLFLAVPWGCLRFVIVVFSDHTHLLFLLNANNKGSDKTVHLHSLISDYAFRYLESIVVKLAECKISLSS